MLNAYKTIVQAGMMPWWDVDPEDVRVVFGRVLAVDAGGAARDDDAAVARLLQRVGRRVQRQQHSLHVQLPHSPGKQL